MLLQILYKYLHIQENETENELFKLLLDENENKKGVVYILRLFFL